MNRYLLLRDNKQSGPYSVSELVQKGIKPYDLVWLDGKSAAWRYPSEIDELKAYAPAVEEQPYDRFYKKPSTEKKEETPAEKQTTRFVGRETSFAEIRVPKETPVEKETPAEKIIPAEVSRPEVVPIAAQFTEPEYFAEPLLGRSTYAPVPESPAPGQPAQPRKIYVTLPGTKQIDKNTRVIRSTSIPASAIATDQSFGQNTNLIQPKPEAVPQDSGYKMREPGNERFSERIPGDEIRNETSSISRGDRPGRVHPLNTRWAMTAVAAICLLLGGVIIGLMISNSRQQSNSDLSKLVKQIQERGTAKDPAKNAGIVIPDQAAQLTPEPAATTNQDLSVSDEPPALEKRQPKTAAQKTTITQTTNTGEPQTDRIATRDEKPSTTIPAVVREEKPVVNANVEDAKKNIRQLVSVQNNKYKTGVLGGISDLQITVTNKSEFELDVVEVEVEYLGPEKRVVKRQIVVFNKIKPGKEVMQEVPKTNRGVTVISSIKGINSKSLGLAYTGL